ncbi:TIR domain-containing protein [Geodermatophilus sp. SYSU D01176]
MVDVARDGRAPGSRPVEDRRAGPVNDRFEYDAFISYSRADADAAKRLKQAVERFATPWYRARGRRVFLDTATLAGSGSLRSAIESALASSRALVLLTSTASRESRWVDEEVTWWLRHRGTDHLHLAVLDGHMDWGEGAQASSAGAPAALRGSWRSAFEDEPLWVDLRWMAGLEDVDRRDPRLTDAAAQLLASIQEVPKDRVVGEHLRRSRRTRQVVTAVIATLLVLLTTAIAATVVAVDRRNVAIEERFTATSRQLVAQSASIEDERPSLARQLLLEAHRLTSTEESVGALIRSPRMSRELMVEGYAPAVAVHATRPLIAVLSGRALRLYDTDSGRLLTTVRDPVPEGGDVAFAPAGSGMAATIGPGRVGIFDVSSAAEAHLLGELRVPDPRVQRVAYAPDGDVLAVHASTATTLYDVADPTNPVELATVPAGDGNDGVVLLDDGTLMSPTRVTGSGVDTASLPVEVIVTPLASSPYAAVTADRQTLALAGPVGDVELWDIADPMHPVLRHSVSGESFGVDSLAFSDDGRVLAVGTSSGVAQLWDLADLTRPVLGERLRGVSAGIRAVAFGSRSRQLVAVSDDPVAPPLDTGATSRSVIRIWPVQGATRAGATSRIDGGRQAVPAWAPDGHSVIAGFPAHSWLLDDPRYPRPGAALPTLAVGGGAAYAYQPGSPVIASGAPVVLWDAADPSAPRSLSDGTTVAEPADLAVFSPDGAVLAVGGQLGAVSLWSVEDRSARTLAQLPGTRAAPHGAAFAGTGSTLVTLDGEGGATLWDVRDPGSPRVLSRVSRPDEDLQAVVVDDRNGVLIAGGIRGSLAAWDITSPAHPRWLGSRAAHTGAITGVALSPDGGVLASAGVDAVRLWARPERTAALAPMTTLEAGGVYNGAAVSFSPDGTLLAAATDGDMQIWDVDVPRLLGQLCAASESISEVQWQEHLPADIPYDPPCSSRG